MKKQILALLLCSVITVCAFPSCGHDNKSTDSSANSTEQSVDTEYKTMKPPEDGWTIEELLSVTYLCGHQLSYPLTLESLGEDFTTNEENGFESDHGIGVYLVYKGEMLVPIGYTSISKISDITDSLPINLFDIDQKVEVKDPICINGISLGATVDEAINALGYPDEGYDNKTLFRYNFKEKTELTLFFEAEKLYSIGFTLN